MARTRVAFVLGVLLWSACGGGGRPTAVAPGPAAAVQLTVGSSGLGSFATFQPSLSSFEVTLLSASLMDADGRTGPDLLGVPRPVELLGLRDASRLLSARDLPSATWRALRLQLGGTPRARDAFGRSMPAVSPISDLLVAFDQPVVADGSAPVQLHLQFELEQSFSFVGNGLGFEPRVLASRRIDLGHRLDAVDGLTIGVDAASQEFTIKVQDRRVNAVTGNLTVQVGPTTALFKGGELLGRLALFDTLNGLPPVTVRGILHANGVFRADVLEVREPSLARIRGFVTAVDQGTGLMRLRLHEITAGVELLAPALRIQGSPGELMIDAATADVIMRRPFASVGSLYDVQPGMPVDVELEMIQAPSLLASRIALEDRRPELSGTFVRPGPVGELTLQLDWSDPSRLFGRFALGVTSVTIEVGASTVGVVDLDHQPAIGVGISLLGTAMRARGDVFGSLADPRMMGQVIKVVPGCLEGEITGVGPYAIAVTWDDLCRPFGGTPFANPVFVALDVNCRVRGHASTRSELIDRLAARSPSERARVRVFGLPDGLGGVTAYELTLIIE